jgi:hypothetical protein
MPPVMPAEPAAAVGTVRGGSQCMTKPETALIMQQALNKASMRWILMLYWSLSPGKDFSFAGNPPLKKQKQKGRQWQSDAHQADRQHGVM